MFEQGSSSGESHLAETVRAACLRAAQEAYEDAAVRGLCAEGAWECALGAIESLDLESVVARADENE